MNLVGTGLVTPHSSYYMTQLLTIDPVQDGITALGVAAQNGHLNVVEMLLAAKCQVDLQAEVSVSASLSMMQGNSPCSYRVMVQYKLIDPVQGGATALHAAAEMDHLKIVEMLLAAKCQVDLQAKVSVSVSG